MRVVGANLIKPEMKASLFDARTCSDIPRILLLRITPENLLDVSSVLVFCDVSIASQKKITSTKVRFAAHMTLMYVFQKFRLICRNISL